MNNTDYFLALNHISGIGPRTVSRCVRLFPELDELFRCTAPTLIQLGLSERVAHAIVAFDFSRISMDKKWQNGHDKNILTWEHPQYPNLLKEISNPPFVLFAKGDLSLFHQPCLAIVGTRKPTPMGRETSCEFSANLSRAGVNIVSGLALGIDAAAHQGCLTERGNTIAVLGSGVENIYPCQHRDLAKKIMENGLICSEFPVYSKANAGHFPQRNRIISGLSLATLVVEAAVSSGSLITAQYALEQNRDVFAIPSSIDNVQAKGCHQLLQQGAKLITSPKDILDELNLGHFFMHPGLLKTEIACENDTLMQCVGCAPTSIERIMSRSGLPMQDALRQLTDLELKGFIKAVPGGYVRYKR